MSSVSIPDLATQSSWLIFSFVLFLEKSLPNRLNSDVSLQMPYSSPSSALSPGRLGVYKYDNARDNAALADQYVGCYGACNVAKEKLQELK